MSGSDTSMLASMPASYKGRDDAVLLVCRNQYPAGPLCSLQHAPRMRLSVLPGVAQLGSQAPTAKLESADRLTQGMYSQQYTTMAYPGAGLAR